MVYRLFDEVGITLVFFHVLFFRAAAPYCTEVYETN